MIEVTPDRHKTAIRRHDLSKPMKCGIRDNIVQKKYDIFDYGCGYGEDITYLKDNGYKATGWDPVFAADNNMHESDVVNLGYIINVIEDPKERADTIKKSFHLAKRAIIISAMTTNVKACGEQYKDGYLTSRNTFQKYYKQSELKEMIEYNTGEEAYAADSGVFYVFKDDDLKASYFENKWLKRAVPTVRRRPSDLAVFKEKVQAIDPELAEQIRSAIEQYGRVPVTEELPEIETLFTSYKRPNAIIRKIQEEVDDELFNKAISQRKDDIKVFLALTKLARGGRPKLHQLNKSTQADIKSFFKTYNNAIVESDRALFSIADNALISKLCGKSPVGKILPDALYVHISATHHLAPVLRIMIELAKRTIGDPEDINLIKIARKGEKVSFLVYKDFDDDPHPELLESFSCQIRKLNFRYFEYLSSENRPILHRKETFLHSSYPRYDEYKKLTEMENAEGLLGNLGIGRRKQWDDFLKEKGYMVQGHTLTSIEKGVCL